MPRNKRSTNVNFAKRIDRESAHAAHKRIGEPSVCEECKAIFLRGRWTFDKEVLNTARLEKIEPREILCPACRRIKRGEPAGFVYLEGDFFNENKQEIKNLLKNETKRASQMNPLARIMKWDEAKEGLTITTTNVNLAKHLGRSLKRAYDGDVRYDFSHENKLARVYWHRD